MIDIYTDGSCGHKDRCGGWAFIAVKRSNRFEPDDLPKHAMPDDEVLLIDSGGETDTTVNRMELTAIDRAMTHIMMAEIGFMKIRIITDSAYSIGSLTEWNVKQSENGWTNTLGEPIANMMLIRTMLVTLHTIRRMHTIQFMKIKGHSGHHYNEEADRLAGEERAKRL